MPTNTNDKISLTNDSYGFNNCSIGVPIDKYVYASDIDLLQVTPVECCSCFNTINEPNEEYLNSTKKIDISTLVNGSHYSSITDGFQTINFSPSVTKLTVPSGWATWSAPPFSESATPPVLYSNGSFSLTLNLNRPSCIFGFELEPNPFANISFTVKFYSDQTLVGTITKVINGRAGARLIAAETSCDNLFNKVVITGGSDFAIAQVRYNTVSCRCCGEEPTPVTFSRCTDYETLPIEVSNLSCQGRLLVVDVTLTACQNKNVAVGVLICDENSNPIRFKVREGCMPPSTVASENCVENTFRFCFIFESELCEPLPLIIKTFAEYTCFNIPCSL